MATRLMEAKSRLRLAGSEFFRTLGMISLLWLLLALWPAQASDSFQPLATFAPPARLPLPGFFLASDGNLYGTSGGTENEGGAAIYRITSDGTFTVLHSFGTNGDDAEVIGGMIEGPDHNFYGVARNVRSYIFKLTPQGQYSDVFDFDRDITPTGPMSLGKDGNLYGAGELTQQAGGIVYQYQPSPRGWELLWSWPPLSHSSPDPIYIPAGSVVRTDDGGIYGFANLAGDPNGSSVLYHVPGNATVSIIPLKPDGRLGGRAGDAILGPDGNLYSVTPTTVFMTTLDGQVTILYRAAQGSLAIPSRLSLSADGSLYGATADGIVKVDATGMTLIFTVPLGTETGMYAPYAISAGDGTFFATAESDSNELYHVGADYDYHEVHRFSPDAQTVYQPGPLVEGSDGNLYGVSTRGGTNDTGTVFRMTPEGDLTVLHSFGASAPDGYEPAGALVLASDGKFYGTTPYGGDNRFGTVFSITPEGTFSTIYSFHGNLMDGGGPPGSLVEGPDGALYGLTSNEGMSYLAAFRLTKDGHFSLLHVFGPTSDNHFVDPVAPLLLGSDGVFYGATTAGYTMPGDSLYSLTIDGVYTTLHAFDPTLITGDGYRPGPPIEGADGALYGPVSYGSDGRTAIYRMTKSGDYSLLPPFGVPGTYPPTDVGVPAPAPLLLTPDGSFYGAYGPYISQPEGLFKVTAPFAPYPQYFEEATYGKIGDSVLMLSREGQIYGSSKAGGLNNAGIIFRFHSPAPPVANDDYMVMRDAKAQTLAVLENDESPNGNPLSIASVTSPALGTATVQGNTVAYTPSQSFAQSMATDSFTYTVADGAGGFSTATVYVSNGFYQQRGSYSGTIEGLPFGALTVNLTGGGMATGTLRLVGGNYTFKVQLSATGDCMVKVKGETLALHLALNGGDPAATGLTGSYGGNAFTLSPKTAPSPVAGLAGYYTFHLTPAMPLDPAVPAGIGFGTVRVAANGAVRLTGVLANGEAFSGSSAVFHQTAGDSAVASIRLGGANPGTLAVSFEFATMPGESDFHGSVDWMTLAEAKRVNYPAGFHTTLGLAGSRYAAPKAGQLEIGGEPDGVKIVTLRTATQSGTTQISLNGRVGSGQNEAAYVSGSNLHCSVSFNRQTGLFTGHSLLPYASGQVNFRGAVLYRNNSAGGFYLKGGESGAIQISGAANTPN